MVRRCLAALVAAVSLLATLAAPVGAGPTSVYRPPVDAPIVDPWRPPATAWGAGNRGIDYGVEPGTPVRASAAGQVVFAGPVGLSRHVVVLHDGGLRTSYSFVAEVLVHRGQIVDAGAVVALAGGPLHFGVRLGDRYLDPRSLFAAGPPVVALVADHHLEMGSVDDERAGLLAHLGGAAAAAWGAVGTGAAGAYGFVTGARAVVVAAAVASWSDLVDTIELALHYARELDPSARIEAAFLAARRWWEQRGRCTPSTTSPPPLPERRILVLVGGLGSSSDSRGLWGVRPEAMGYDPADVVVFSYRGGRVPGVGDVGGVPVSTYDAADTGVDLTVSGERLRSLLGAIHRSHPDVPVDVVAHSQGGLIARLALVDTERGPVLPPVRTLVTLGSPHGGADLATGLSGLDASQVGSVIMGAIRVGADVTGHDQLSGPAISQVSETSDLIRGLRQVPLPPETHVTSIGARGDLVVPAEHTHLDGADNVIVSAWGASAHDRLPGDAEARREVALAVAGMPPTCQSLADMVLDALAADTISMGEDLAGLAINVGVRWLDAEIPAPPIVRTPGPVAGGG